MNKRALSCFLLCACFLSGCSSAFLKYDKEDQLKKIEEFDKAVKIEPQPGAVAAGAAVDGKPATETATITSAKPGAKATEGKVAASDSKTKNKHSKKSKKAADAAAAEPVSTRRQPDLEDDTGFNGRRPIVDPFRVGEEVIHDVSYFKMSAGELHMSVKPFVTVNGRKAYDFGILVKTVSLFSSFYSVEDTLDTFVDYETLVPSVFEIHVKESGQLREGKMLFDNTKNLATFWEKKVTKENGVEEKKQNWDLAPFSQNVYSAIFYMRNFQWEVGKEISFRVSNDNENLIFSGKALRKEVLDTKLGPMKAIVIQPNIVLKGKFKPIGDNLIWLSDDEHRYILRIEAKIKIGTLVSQVIEIKPGH